MANELTITESLGLAIEEVRPSLPAGYQKERAIHNFMSLINGNDVIKDYMKKYPKEITLPQLRDGFLKASFLNLDFMMKEAHLIPYGSTLSFVVDYKGDVKIAKAYSVRPIKDIFAYLVREGDEFTYTVVDGVTSYVFKPKPFNKADIIGGFAVCLYEDGGNLFEEMDIDQLNACKSQSKQANGMAWKKFPTEMYKKCIIHRICKHITIDLSEKQREIFDADTELETDTQAIVEAEIQENANAEPFVIEV